LREREFRSRHGVGEPDRFRMERLMIQIGQEKRGLSPASGRKCQKWSPTTTVFLIPEHGMAQMGEVDPDLVGPQVSSRQASSEATGLPSRP